MLSEADNRVLAHLRRHGPSGLAAIGAACFREAGKPRHAGNRPAAAHLARMRERGLITRQGSRHALAAGAAQDQWFAAT